MKKQQTKYFIIGLLFLFLALFNITFLPVVLKILFGNIRFTQIFYTQFEFVLFVICGVFYLFSPKYYREQILSIVLWALIYTIFVKMYWIFN